MPYNARTILLYLDACVHLPYFAAYGKACIILVLKTSLFPVPCPFLSDFKICWLDVLTVSHITISSLYRDTSTALASFLDFLVV